MHTTQLHSAVQTFLDDRHQASVQDVYVRGTKFTDPSPAVMTNHGVGLWQCRQYPGWAMNLGAGDKQFKAAEKLSQGSLLALRFKADWEQATPLYEQAANNFKVSHALLLTGSPNVLPAEPLEQPRCIQTATWGSTEPDKSVTSFAILYGCRIRKLSDNLSPTL